MTKNIIFDWSGVVSDSISNVHQVAMEIFKKRGAEPISLEEFKREWEQPYMVFYNKYLPDLTQGEEDDAYVEEIKKLPMPNIFPGIREMLVGLKEAEKNMIVLSSDPVETIHKEIKHYGLSGVFKEVYAGKHDKREVIEEVFKKYDFEKEESIFIGDTAHEVEAGRKVGIKTGAVTWGYQLEERIKQSKPDYIFHTVKELESILIK